ncbi:hypothetical protein [Acidiphilium sp.]|uniref:hypothetical protein n=1 Tax=Acidiphilium sp. TaxID=527 RepID=UPI003D01B9A5
MFNILTEPLIRTHRSLTLPGLFAALARDEVESFPALRPHQGPIWHMFLVQLAALALRRSGGSHIFEDEEAWASALRNLAPGFAADEPWNLVVHDWEKPAFLQPSVPKGMTLSHPVLTADALDLLITSKNHDIKQAVARQGQPEDWLFALVSLQTGEGYGGAGNQGIARMNGGSSSRPLLTFAPLPTNAEKIMTPRPGARFRRDVTVLLETYEGEIERHDYYSSNGIGLTWLAPWPEGDQLQLKDLDLWFIEVCRRVRLSMVSGVLSGWKGTSNATRINAKHLKGALGDPFAPVHKTDNKSFTLAGRDFDYNTLVDLLFSGNWIMPVLARPASCDGEREMMSLVAEALARGNSKTEGFKSRILPIAGKISRTLGTNREQLHELAKSQIATIGVFDKAIGNSLALAAASGDRDKINKGHYIYARKARNQFDRAMDSIFFQYLWDRLEAQDEGPDRLEGQKLRWSRTLYNLARTAFETALPGIPCSGMFRPRAEARARGAFIGFIRHHNPEMFEQPEREGAGHAD